MNSFLKLPLRESKPRTNGLTMMMDSGLGVMQAQDILQTAGNYIDFAKLGWGTAIVTETLEEKIALYKKYSVVPYFGGTLFELAWLQGKVDEYADFVESQGVEWIEVSDGTVMLSRAEKSNVIRRLSKRFKVFSEVGGKDASTIEAPKIWVEKIQEDLDSGASLVIAEGREAGNAGLYRRSKELRTGLVDEIVDSIDPKSLLWETPHKAQQTWFINNFGSSVNLGNIQPSDAIALETLRLGLRSDTLLQFHQQTEEADQETDISTGVLNIVAQATRISPEDIPIDAPFSHLPQFDSLAHVQIITALEKDFPITITLEDELNHFTDIGSLVTMVKGKLSNA